MSLATINNKLAQINGDLIEPVAGSGRDTSIVNPYIGNFYWTYFNSAYGSTYSSWRDAPYLTDLEYAKRLSGSDITTVSVDWPGRYALEAKRNCNTSMNYNASVSFASSVSLPNTRTCSCMVQGCRSNTYRISRPHQSTHEVYLFGIRFIIGYDYDLEKGPSTIISIRCDRSGSAVGFQGRTCNGWSSSYSSSYNTMSKRIYGSDDVIPWVRFSYVKSNGKVFCYVNSEYCGYFTVNLSDSNRQLFATASGGEYGYDYYYTLVTEMFINSTDLTSNNRGKLNLASQPSFDSSSLPDQL